MNDMDKPGFAVWSRSRTQRIRTLKTNVRDVVDGLYSIVIICWELLTWRNP